jgi:hypothetical protein
MDLWFTIVPKLKLSFQSIQDARAGISTGVSAEDRTKTILTLASPDSKPSDLRRPGHIFPLKYRKGGVLKRVGQSCRIGRSAPCICPVDCIGPEGWLNGRHNNSATDGFGA